MDTTPDMGDAQQTATVPAKHDAGQQHDDGRSATEIGTEFRGLTLLPFQRNAIAEIRRGFNVVVAAPTGAGKTLVADWAIEDVLKRNRRAIYTSPVKALSNQKYRDYKEFLGVENVGLLTGDVKINAHARALVMTTEIFQNWVMEAPETMTYFDLVVFDELHYLDDDVRGTIWEEAIMFAPEHMQMIALSASLPNIDNVLAWMEKLGRRMDVRRCAEEKRPVPLIHRYWVSPHAFIGTESWPGRFNALETTEVPDWWIAGRPKDRRLRASWKRNGAVEQDSQALIDHLQETGQLPAIYFCTARDDCESLARLHAERNLIDVDQRDRALQLFDELVERYMVKHDTSTKSLRELVGNGIAFHHAGMIPSLKPVVEELFTSKLLHLLFATDTFAVGVNMPAKAVCFHYLAKYKGKQGTRPLMGREYSQMAGRAGRLGKDIVGHVYSILDFREATREDLCRYAQAEVEPIYSHFDPSYRSLLTLVFARGLSIEQIWERSFAHFTSESKKDRRYETIKARWEFLRRVRYYTWGDGEEPFRPLKKGQICQGINGAEIHITEACDRKFLEKCSPSQVCALFAAIACHKAVFLSTTTEQVFEPSLQQQYMEWIYSLIELEEELLIPEDLRLRKPIFKVAPLAHAWAEGEPLDQVLGMIKKGCGFGAGDFVMTMRMSVQGITSLYRMLPPGEACRPILKEAAARLQRDEVDATQQLTLLD